MLTISQELRDLMVAHARQDHPDEACGVIAGPAGSLQLLRKLGYRVFDGILDNSYDQEPDHTQRWLKLSKAICHAQEHLHELFNNALTDIEHNQQLFQAIKTDRLNNLIKDINEHH